MGESNVSVPVEGGGGGEEGGGRKMRNKGCLKKCPLDVELLKNLKFQLFAISSALNWGSTYLVHLLIVDFATDRGFRLEQGASLLTLLGAFAIFSRLLTGLFCLIKCINNITWYIFFSMAVGVTHACIPLITSYSQLVGLASFMGMLFGFRFSVFVMTLLELVPIQKYSQALGYCLSLWGVAVMITGPIVGKISIINKSYDSSYTAGGIIGMACMIPIATYLIKSRGRFVLNFPSTDRTQMQTHSPNGN